MSLSLNYSVWGDLFMLLSLRQSPIEPNLCSESGVHILLAWLDQRFSWPTQRGIEGYTEEEEEGPRD